MFCGYILGMDAFAFGLEKAAEIIEDRRLETFIAERYAAWDSNLGRTIRSGKATLEGLSGRACGMKGMAVPMSGRQEYLEGVLNNIILH